MKNTDIFKPIYIWAQAKDNISDDDFYQLNNGHAELVTDLELIQNKAHEMGKVVKKYHERKDTGFSDKINSAFKNNLYKTISKFKSLEIYYSGSKFLLKFGASDKDVVGRMSDIDVFLDLEGVNKSNINNYIQFFYNGFKEFCEKTDRHPYDIEKVKSPDFESLLSDNGNTINEVLDNLPSLIRENIMVIIIISIAFIVLLLLTQS